MMEDSGVREGNSRSSRGQSTRQRRSNTTVEGLGACFIHSPTIEASTDERCKTTEMKELVTELHFTFTARSDLVNGWQRNTLGGW
jgi:hypothetical protein